MGSHGMPWTDGASTGGRTPYVDNVEKNFSFSWGDQEKRDSHYYVFYVSRGIVFPYLFIFYSAPEDFLSVPHFILHTYPAIFPMEHDCIVDVANAMGDGL